MQPESGPEQRKPRQGKAGESRRPQRINISDLPADVRDSIGQPCDPADCSSCAPGDHLTCQFVETVVEQVPARILNARKGDLVLCPGDGRGTIGTLLGALRAPQVYTHMGIVVEDFTTIRHSTDIPDRMQAHPVGSLVGQPEPLDGFDPEMVKYGWPGTLTQTVDEAFQAQNPGIVPTAASQTPPYLYCDADNGTQPFSGPSPGNHCFSCNELSFNTVFGQDGTRRDPLVVSPCTAAEMAHPELRQILHAIADEAKGINGHYRFYAYSDATIAQKPSYFREGAMPVYHWSTDRNRWVAVENQVFDPDDPCAPPSRQSPVPSTVPVVCSSLPWLAVQKYNARQQQYTVVLFNRSDTGIHPLPGCTRLVPPNRAGFVPDPSGQTPDGLFFFSAEDRASAAQAFNSGLELNVKEQVAAAWNGIAEAIQSAEGTVPIPVLFALSVVLQCVSFVGWSVAGLAAILGISENSAADIIDFFSALPAHVANQICNAFASDDAADYSSDAWRTPGPGRAVGPDDIVWFWGPHRSFTPAVDGPTRVDGIYGQNRKLILQQPGWGTVARCAWAVSEGPAKVTGFASFSGTNGEPAVGALVQIACHEAWTNSDGFYEMVAPSGTYWGSARWQDPATGELWITQQEVKLPLLGQHAGTNFVLSPPPADFREVNINVSGDAVEGSVWAQGNWPPIGASGTVYLGPRGNPNDPGDSAGLTGQWASGPMIYQDTH